MTSRCPVCRADNPPASPSCRRCRADLSLLAALEQRRDYHIATAAHAVREGRYDDAVEQLHQADRLRQGPDTRSIRQAISLLLGAYPDALTGPQAATRP